METSTSGKERVKRMHRARGYIDKAEDLESNVHDRTLLKKPLQTKRTFHGFSLILLKSSFSFHLMKTFLKPRASFHGYDLINEKI